MLFESRIRCHLTGKESKSRAIFNNTSPKCLDLLEMQLDLGDLPVNEANAA